MCSNIFDLELDSEVWIRENPDRKVTCLLTASGTPGTVKIVLQLERGSNFNFVAAPPKSPFWVPFPKY